jgi:putative lipoic acid-binding regulatory protein
MIEQQETLLKFPCQFPIKAMGKADIEFDLLVLEIIHQHVMPEKTVLSSRSSKNGKYLAVTVIIEATSKEQLDNIYLQLSSHPLVLMAL